jgi:hypothetical protein
MPNLVYHVRGADSIRVRVSFLIDAVESRKDGMDRNFGWLAGQHMAAQRSARTPDQTCSTQCPEYLVEIRFRNILPGGNLLAVNRTSSSPQGEFKERSDAVVRAT